MTASAISDFSKNFWVISWLLTYTIQIFLVEITDFSWGPIMWKEVDMQTWVMLSLFQSNTQAGVQKIGVEAILLSPTWKSGHTAS